MTPSLNCSTHFQCQAANEAKAQLREALAAEQATGAMRQAEVQRLTERDLRATLQVHGGGGVGWRGVMKKSTCWYVMEA